ncbi:MAG: hypothetical protein ACRYFT_07390 [Janthinobacterium lividum]
MATVTFRAFRAYDEPDTCLRFIEGHRKVLEAYGITMITSNNAKWISHKNTYVILVEATDDCRALGGVKVQIADEEIPLPMVDAVAKVDPKIYDVFNQYKNVKVAEACGMWNSREIAGHGYSFFILRAAIALAYQLRVKHFYALAAPVTVNMCLNAGFIIERSLGKDGFFNYPKLDLVATAMVINDLKLLSNATEQDRNVIYKLMDNPVQLLKETGPKGEITIDYKLLIVKENENS